jgi:lipoprotein-anchoring transpeptidase ErfK/SrfK
MGKTKRDTPGAGPLIVLGVVAALILGVLIYYVKSSPIADLKPTAPDRNAPHVTVRIPVIKRAGPDPRFDMEVRQMQAGADPVIESVNAFLEATHIVQPEARLVSAKVEGDNITLDFTTNFNQSYGTDDEAMLIKGIMRALNSNCRSKTATFTAGGKPIETLGNIDITGPQKIRDWLG